MSNKVTYGLEKVHIAFLGQAQAEQITVTAPCTVDGEITVTVTAGTILGGSSPASVIVPLAAETHDTVAKVASTIANAFNNDETISGKFSALAVAGVITLTAKTVAANDATLTISATVGSTGVTVGASTNLTAGTTGWGTPTAIPGAVRWTPSAVGQESKFYADNMTFHTVTSNDGYTAELEMALIPDAVLVEMLGWKTDTNGVVVEVADGLQKEFAILFEVKGDERNRRAVHYRCKASRPAKEHTTTGETIEPKSDVLSVTVMPIELNGEKVIKGTMERSVVSDAVFDAFFNTVYIPTFA